MRLDLTLARHVSVTLDSVEWGDPGVPPPFAQPQTGDWACACFRLSAEDVRKALTDRDIRTVAELKRETGAGSGCTACHPRLRALCDQTGYSGSCPPSCSVK